MSVAPTSKTELSSVVESNAWSDLARALYHGRSESECLALAAGLPPVGAATRMALALKALYLFYGRLLAVLQRTESGGPGELLGIMDRMRLLRGAVFVYQVPRGWSLPLTSPVQMVRIVLEGLPERALADPSFTWNGLPVLHAWIEARIRLDELLPDLIACGAGINQVHDGYTPLMRLLRSAPAWKVDHVEHVRPLLDAGATAAAVHPEHLTAWYMALRWFFLTKFDDDGIFRFDLKLFECLIQNGADPDYRAPPLGSPSLHAMLNVCPNGVEVRRYLEHLASAKVNLRQVNHLGQTLMHLCFERFEGMVEPLPQQYWWNGLASHPAGWNQWDAFGESPFGVAYRRLGPEKFVNLLDCVKLPGTMWTLATEVEWSAIDLCPQFEKVRAVLEGRVSVADFGDVEEDLYTDIKRFGAGRVFRQAADSSDDARAGAALRHWLSYLTPEKLAELHEYALSIRKRDLALAAPPPAATLDPDLKVWPLYSDKQVKDYENYLTHAGLQSNVEARAKTFVTKARERGGLRPLAAIKDGAAAIESLQQGFPHFGPVISHLTDHVALQAKGDGSFYVPPMVLVGPPGIGKTFFCGLLAKLMGTAFHSISMESVSAGFVLVGNDSRWSAGRHGLVFEHLFFGETANPLILLDEVDKCRGDSTYPPDQCLLGLMEPVTAQSFRDEAVPLALDIRRVNWVATANELKDVSAPLRSRFEVFDIPAPNVAERRALVGAVYGAVRAGHDWGTHIAPDLVGEVVEALVADEGSTRDLRRTLITACAKAFGAGRGEIWIEDVPAFVPHQRKPWDRPLALVAPRVAAV